MDALSAILLVALGVILTCLAGLGLFVWLLSNVFRGDQMTTCSFCQRQRERWKRLVAKIRGKRA